MLHSYLTPWSFGALFRAGWTQLALDASLFAAVFAVLDPLLLAWSLLGAVVINLIIAVNHRRDGYVAR